MIDQKYCTEDIPISLQDIVHAYNTSCSRFCNYAGYVQFPYILTSSTLLGVLLKKILLKVNGGYGDSHIPKDLVQSLSSLGVSIRSFTEEEISFLKLDFPPLKHEWFDIESREIKEDVVDGIFEYFLKLALRLRVEEPSCLEQGKLLRRVFRTPQLKEGTYRAFIWEPGSVIVIPLVEYEESIYRESLESFTHELMYGEYDFNIGFDHGGGMKAVERMLRCGCEEVIV